MKYLIIVTTLTLLHGYNSLRSMEYALAPFKCTYNLGCFLLGNETLLEKDTDSFLNTLSVSHCATKGELESFVTKNTEKHINDRVKSSPLYLAYLGALFLRDPEVVDKIIKKTELFIEEQAKIVELPKNDSKHLEYTDEGIDWAILTMPTGSIKK